jgi:hypothetical protein
LDIASARALLVVPKSIPIAFAKLVPPRDGAISVTSDEKFLSRLKSESDRSPLRNLPDADLFLVVPRRAISVSAKRIPIQL